METISVEVELEEAPESEESETEEIEELREEIEEEIEEDIEQQIKELDAMAEMLDKVWQEAEIEIEEEKEIIENAEIPTDPNEAVQRDGSESDKRIDKLTDVLEKLSENMQKSSPKNKAYNCKKFWGLVIGAIGVIGNFATITGTIIAFLEMEEIKKRIYEQDKKTYESICNLLNAWNSLTTEALFKKFAIYVKEANLSISGQVYSLNYICRLSPLKTPVIWTTSEKVNLAEQLAQECIKSNKIYSMYEKVAKIEFNGKPLPKYCAANLCQLAIAILKADGHIAEEKDRSYACN